MASFCPKLHVPRLLIKCNAIRFQYVKMYLWTNASLLHSCPGTAELFVLHVNIFFPGFPGLRWGSGTSARALTNGHWTSLRGRPSSSRWTMKSKGWGERTQQETWTATLNPCCMENVTTGEDDTEEVNLPLDSQEKQYLRQTAFSFLFFFSGGLINPSPLWSTRMERADLMQSIPGQMHQQWLTFGRYVFNSPTDTRGTLRNRLLISVNQHRTDPSDVIIIQPGKVTHCILYGSVVYQFNVCKLLWHYQI